MKKQNLYLFIILLSVIGGTACNRASEGSRRASEKITKTTTAQFETTPVVQGVSDDAADDPAIWFNKHNPDKSRIIGTDKKGGLAIFNLKGEQLFYYADGMMNNVDLRYGFELANDTIDIVCASNRTNQSIAIYKINADGSLVNLSARPIISKMHDEVYGFCLYQSPKTGKYFAFINSKRGEVEQWELFSAGDMIDARLVRHFNLKTQVEGMLADDENKTLFIGEEINGVWKFDAEPDGSSIGSKLAKSSESDNENIRFDIEGLSMYYLPNGNGYLLASSQGNYSYAVYERVAPHKYLGSFRITDGLIDGTEETDGIDIFSFPLNSDFKHGLFVAQDGYNYDDGKQKAQNFKLVAWENIAQLFSPALQMN